MNTIKSQIPKGKEPTSKIDLLTGRYTKDILVALLILFILGAICFAGLTESLQGKLFDGLYLLIGFFAGSKIK